MREAFVLVALIALQLCAVAAVVPVDAQWPQLPPVATVTTTPSPVALGSTTGGNCDTPLCKGLVGAGVAAAGLAAIGGATAGFLANMPKKEKTVITTYWPKPMSASASTTSSAGAVAIMAASGAPHIKARAAAEKGGSSDWFLPVLLWTLVVVLCCGLGVGAFFFLRGKLAGTGKKTKRKLVARPSADEEEDTATETLPLMGSPEEVELNKRDLAITPAETATLGGTDGNSQSMTPVLAATTSTPLPQAFSAARAASYVPQANMAARTYAVAAPTYAPALVETVAPSYAMAGTSYAAGGIGITHTVAPTYPVAPPIVGPTSISPLSFPPSSAVSPTSLVLPTVAATQVAPSVELLSTGGAFP